MREGAGEKEVEFKKKKKAALDRVWVFETGKKGLKPLALFDAACVQFVRQNWDGDLLINLREFKALIHTTAANFTKLCAYMNRCNHTKEFPRSSSVNFTDQYQYFYFETELDVPGSF